MSEIGPRVCVSYEARIETPVGEIVDKKENYEFTPGTHAVIEKFEEAVQSMNQGETHSFQISANDAYGKHDPDLILKIAREVIPQDVSIEEGKSLQLGEGNEAIIVRIIDVSEEAITVDGNHPLAGQTLFFKITKHSS